MVLDFPRVGEFQLRDDPLIQLRNLLKMHRFVGRTKYFLMTAIIIKSLVVINRVGFILFCFLDQPQRLAELTATLPVVITGVWKMIHLYFDRRRVEYFYDSITSEFWDYRISGPEIETRAIKAFTFIKRIIGFHFILTVTSMSLFLMFPVAEMPSEDDRFLPNVVWAPFDLNVSPVYEIVFVVILVNGILTYIGNIAYDFLYLYTLQHLFVQFMLLKGLMANITDGIMAESTDVEKFKSEYFQRTIMDRLKICAEHHSRLLKYGNNIATFCSNVLVPQLIMTYASLVVNGFSLTAGILDFKKSVILLLLSMSTFMQIALFAIPSTHLYSQSLSVLDAIYDSKWYLFNSSMKRACTFMMMNGEEGIVIKAAGIVKIDNPLLVDMMQKVFSAITLIKALVEGSAED